MDDNNCESGTKNMENGGQNETNGQKQTNVEELLRKMG